MLRKAGREMEVIGFGAKSGLLLPEKPPQSGENLTDEDILDQGVATASH